MRQCKNEECGRNIDYLPPNHRYCMECWNEGKFSDEDSPHQAGTRKCLVPGCGKNIDNLPKNYKYCVTHWKETNDMR